MRASDTVGTNYWITKLNASIKRVSSPTIVETRGITCGSRGGLPSKGK